MLRRVCLVAGLVGVVLVGCGRRQVAAPPVTAALPAPEPESPEQPDVAPERGPGICSASGWCWHHPLPQGNVLRSLAGTAATQVWAVGNDTLLRFDGERWERIAGAPDDVWFKQLAPRAAGGFWALGQRWHVQGDQGLLYAWDGRQWRDTGLVTPPSIDMWVAGDRDIWLLSEGGRLSRWNGEALRDVPAPPTADGNTLAGTDERDVWLGADDGLFHWDGQRWTRVRREDTTGLLVRAPGDVWAADLAAVHHLEGRAWRSWPLAHDLLRRLYDGGDGSVWLVDSEQVLRFTAGEWRTIAANDSRLRALWSAPDGTAWGVGDKGILSRWDGERWTQSIDRQWLHSLRAIWGAADDDVWAAGDRGFVAHFDGRVWTRVAIPETATIRALWGSSANDVWAVGNGFFHWDGRAWSKADVHTWDSMDAVWGTGPNDVWAYGTDVVLHFDGCWWSADLAVGSFHRARGGATTAPGEPVLPALPGLLSKRDGAWKIATASPQGGIVELHGTPRTGVWALQAARSGQALLRLDAGDIWTPLPLPAAAKEVVRFHVQEPDALWIVDHDGGVYRWDGATWHDEAQDLTRFDPNALWVSPGGDIWLATHDDNAGLLRKRAATRTARAAAATPPASPAPTCGPDPTAVTLAAELVHVDGGELANSGSVAAADARETARVWLEALRNTQTLTLARVSALPLTVQGFTPCGDAPRVGRDVEEFRDLIDCAFSDSVKHYVPREADGEWTPRKRGLSGTLKVIRPSGLARRMARYRPAVDALAREGHVLVQARTTDNNGMTIHFLVAVRATASGSRVVAVYVDELFEE
ncbi:hypothetical protein [Nannocystis sp. SCPEA4]|uniref:hypothetical protein n=1 Tax=Nannocystis sp. SCPEA4 TaxID=2996787 RepID=UPI00226D406A|nr:hypothetical protein [Nannocystis sp. SCPEA4]MCY1057389.1 hypothetical protein [Nannocystis sp. SCPEA4]